MSSVKAEVDSKNHDVTYIAHFTNGKVTRSDGLALGQFVKQDNRKRKQAIMVAESPTMSYIGKNFGPDASKAQSYCSQLSSSQVRVLSPYKFDGAYYVGVVDRKQRKMKVLDAEIVQMVPKLPDFQEQEKKEAEKIKLQSNLDRSYRERIDDLTASFGSKKKRQAMGSRIKNEIHGEALEKALSSVVDDVVSKQKHVQTVQEEGHLSLLPPFNIDATSPQDVYSLDSIISPDVLESLTSVAQVFFDSTRADVTTWAEKEQYPKYIVNHLAILPSTAETKWRKCKILMFLNYLIHIFTLNTRSFKVKDPLPKEWPAPVKELCYKQFMMLVNSGNKQIRCCPARLKEKLVLHIIVLCLIIDEFDLPLDDLQRDLKLGQRRLLDHVRAVGCKVKTQRVTTEENLKLEVKTAVLETPLKFPERVKPKAKAKR